ncbi:MAG: DHH family phosphoesterase [Erysipelotrichaceae bacterium]
MNYEFRKCMDLKQAILDYNGLNIDDLKCDYDLVVKDEVFLNFRDYLLTHRNNKYLLIGDYDFDGISATVIMKRLLNHLGINSNHYIPSRIKEGYGVNKSIIDKAINYHFDTIILLDNGIIATECINKARENNIDVLIIDHHEYSRLPDANLIIHDRLVEEKYSSLSAAGLCFILSRTVYEDELSLVLGASAILSDMMPVLGFNRYLLNEMLKVINNQECMKLLNDGKTISYQDISFNIIPKINAVSRMEPEGNPNLLIRFFNDAEYARTYIEKINCLNSKRKQETKLMYDEALRIMDNSNISVIASKAFREGLCGLIANKLLSSFNRPFIVLNIENGICKGSGRAPEGFNLYEKLKEYDGYEAFGGHNCAIGMSIKLDNLRNFKDFTLKLMFEDDVKKEVLVLDNNLLSEDSIRLIESLEPFGNGFKLPLMAIENRGYRKFIISNRYPKYTVSGRVSAICFNEAMKNVDGAYFIGSLRKDSYRSGCLSFVIEDII